jgi:cytochrome c5
MRGSLPQAGRDRDRRRAAPAAVLAARPRSATMRPTAQRGAAVPGTHPTSASNRRLFRLLGLAAGAAATAACVSTATPPRPLATGEQVYTRVCAACHATRVERAPQFGDRHAWKELLEEGQDVLTAHAWVGVRAMPPRGGAADLSLEEFARATAYMARSAGGDWKDPDARMLHEIEEEVAERLKSLEGKK